VGERRVVAVHRLRPGGHRALDGRVDDVRVESLVGERQVAHLGDGAGRVLVVDLGVGDALGQRVGHRGLDAGAIGHAPVLARVGLDRRLELVLASASRSSRPRRPGSMRTAPRPPRAPTRR